MKDKSGRVAKANEFIQAIAECGRQFFNHDGRISAFDIGSRGHIYFVDGYMGKRIYTHYPGHWRGFNNGGTMRRLVENLRDYIRTGEGPKLALGPFPDIICYGDPWGYGNDMEMVRQAARRIFGKEG